jgi:ATP-binding cassette subfamily C (CFTR/MRP) protein 1
LRRSKILLSDEASSGIDRVTDAKIQAMIRTEFRTVTTLTIAHRLESIFDSDMVLVLRAGRVEEFDAPSRLLEKTDSLFASLVSEMKKNDTNL